MALVLGDSSNPVVVCYQSGLGDPGLNQDIQGKLNACAMNARLSNVIGYFLELCMVKASSATLAVRSVALSIIIETLFLLCKNIILFKQRGLVVVGGYCRAIDITL